MVREAKYQARNIIVSDIEDNIHSRKTIYIKVMKPLNRTVKDIVKTNPVSKEEWQRHRKDLWYNKHYGVLKQTTHMNPTQVIFQNLKSLN